MKSVAIGGRGAGSSVDNTFRIASADGNGGKGSEASSADLSGVLMGMAMGEFD